MSKIKVTINEQYFDVIGKKQSWLIGLLAADGNVTKGKYISISQSGSNGIKIINHIKEEINHNGNIYETPTYRQTSYELYFCSPKTVGILKKHNVIDNKSLVLKYPSCLPPELDKSFMRGYFEGDGSVGIYLNAQKTAYLCASFVGTSDFIEHCKKIVPPGWRYTHVIRANNTHELRWNGEKAVRFCEWLWQDQDLYHSYKEDIYLDFTNNYNPKYKRYKVLQEQARGLMIEGMPPMVISKTMNLPFQTIYTWKKKWEL